MTTGLLDITIDHIRICGYFKDGKLVNGTVENGVDVYSGTFSKSGKLEGDTCTLFVQNKIYHGMFKDGVITQGKCYLRKDKSLSFDQSDFIECGTYYTSKFDKFILQYGKKFYSDRIEHGAYNSSGNLTEGTVIQKDGTKCTGKFYQGKLFEGEILYTNVSISVKYKLNSDSILEYCYVDYNGPIHSLSPQQIMFYCCRSKDSSKLHKFYKEHLAGKSIDELLLLNINDLHQLTTVDTDDLITMRIILRNISTPVTYPKESVYEPDVTQVQNTDSYLN